jgi:glycerate 2-kinase
MQILVAPNAFKGTIPAGTAAELIQAGIQECYPDANSVLEPIADGGDGTCLLLGQSMGYQKNEAFGLDPLGRSKAGFYFLDGETAFIDVSTLSGIQHLHPYELDPHVCSSYGTGQLIKLATAKGATHIVLGLGGSATIDMGLGILAALGFGFLDQLGREITPFSPGAISKIAHIQRPLANRQLQFTCLCDVNNKFFGPNGAIPVFGPQKGLKEQEIETFTKHCQKAVAMLSAKSGLPFEDLPGFGAAGGIALGLSFFYSVNIVMGATYFFKQIGMEEKISLADIIITGEGRYDKQSAGGKGPFELLQMAKKAGKTCVLITSGNVGTETGFDQVITLPDLDFTQHDFSHVAQRNLYDSVVQQLKL